MNQCGGVGKQNEWTALDKSHLEWSCSPVWTLIDCILVWWIRH